MSTSITAAFIGDYSADVHQVFQREGSALRPTVFSKDNVVGSTAYFEKLGTGTATTKSRHGEITPMNATHTQPSCTLADFYAGDWVDSLDELKTNINVKAAYAKAGAYALGRKVDDQITAVLNSTTQTGVTFAVTSYALIKRALLSMTAALDANSVPNDGQRFGALTPMAWAQAETVTAFSSADYVGSNGLPFTTGAPGFRKYRSWNGVNWCVHSGLPGVGTNAAKCYVWHKYSVGYAAAKYAGNIATNGMVGADITWHGDRAAHFVNHSMSGAACMIDDTGVIEATLDDTAAIAAS